MPTVHINLVKSIAALTKRIGKTSDPDLVASEMMRLITEDMSDNPDLWPGSMESKMAEANMLISEHFS